MLLTSGHKCISEAQDNLQPMRQANAAETTPTEELRHICASDTKCPWCDWTCQSDARSDLIEHMKLCSAEDDNNHMSHSKMRMTGSRSATFRKAKEYLYESYHHAISSGICLKTWFLHCRYVEHARTEPQWSTLCKLQSHQRMYATSVCLVHHTGGSESRMLKTCCMLHGALALLRAL